MKSAKTRQPECTYFVATRPCLPQTSYLYVYIFYIIYIHIYIYIYIVSMYLYVCRYAFIHEVAYGSEAAAAAFIMQLLSCNS